MQEVCLVTGQSGFLGKALTIRLEQLGFKVIGFKHDRYVWDIPNLNPQYIFHLAGYGNHYDQRDEAMIFDANTGLLFEIMNAVKKLPLKGFFNFSTSGHVLECNSFYGATKMAGEYIARAFTQKYGMSVVNIRPYSVYGPGEAGHRFIPTIIRKGLAGEEIEVSEGVHDWIYIDDFISGVIMVMENVDKLKGQSIDIGTGGQCSNEEVIKILQAFMPKELKIKHSEKRRSYDTLGEWKASPNKLAKLGIFHTRHLIDGLRETYGYFKQRP